MRRCLWLWIKWLTFPGFDIATRKRIRLSRYFVPGDVLTLDAGGGNGAFSLAAYRLGNRVISIDVNAAQVVRNEEFRQFLGVPVERCRFLRHNIYDVASLGLCFDQIICFETLEHLQRDQEVLEQFARLQRPGGVLHICVPRLDRAPYFGETISSVEDGGHVRLGYAVEGLRDMLTRAGYEVLASARVVGPIAYWIGEAARRISGGVLRTSPRLVKEVVAGGVVLALLPLSWLDAGLFRNKGHLCIYVRGRRVDGRNGACQ